MQNARGICQRSGFEYPLADLVREYTGLLVHPRFLDQRHPQDYPNVPRPERPLPYSSPEGEPVFLEINEITAADL